MIYNYIKIRKLKIGDKFRILENFVCPVSGKYRKGEVWEIGKWGDAIKRNSDGEVIDTWSIALDDFPFNKIKIIS